MRRWIKFNINHPKIVIILLIAVTVLAALGYRNIYFDSSTDALMPNRHIAFKLLQRTKEVFGDSKTFLITAIEPSKGEKLLSNRVFSYMNLMIQELQEFKNFDPQREDERLKILMQLGNVSIKKSMSIKTDQTEDSLKKESPIDEKDDLDAELDKELADDKGREMPKDKIGASDIESTDIWNLDKPIKNDFYVTPTREHYKYNFENYKPVKLSILKDGLDPVAKRQLESIIIYNKFKNLNEGVNLTRDQYEKILNTWEKLYLYKSMEIIRRSLDPISGQDIKGTENELRPVDFIKKNERGERILPVSEKDFNSYRDTLFNNPAYNSVLYSLDENGKIRALSMITTMRQLKDHVEIFNYFQDLIRKYNRSPVVLTTLGSFVYQAYLTKYMLEDLKMFVPFVLLVVLLTFYFNFRSIRGVFLPIISVFLGTAWTFGLMGHLGVPITLVVNVLPPLLIAVGSSYSIHIFNQYLLSQERLHKEGKNQGMLTSMSHISLTVLLAALTTFIGFMTLTVSQLTSLRDFGIFAAIGTLLSMFAAVMLIPSALMMMKLMPVKKKNKGEEHHRHTNAGVEFIIRLFSRLSLNHSRAVVLAAVIIIVVCGYGISRIYVESSMAHMLKKDSFLYQADLRLGRLFKGFLVTNLIIDSGKPEGIKDPEFLKLIEEVREWITIHENQVKYGILDTASFGDIIKRMHKAMNGDKPEYFVIPDDQSVINDYMELYSGVDSDSDGRVDALEQFIDPNFRYVNILIRKGAYKDQLLTTRRSEAGENRIRKYLENHPKAKKYRWHSTGEPNNFFIIGHLLVEGQIISISLTLVIISLIIFTLFRNWKAGLIAIIPISTSVIFVYGLMGFLDIPLDIPKAILAAIAIGIGVDDTIHMMKTLRFHLKKGLQMKEAMIESYKEAGLAIVYTSVALIFGFSVLLFSEFIVVFSLGLLISLTMVVTTISALVLLPAVIILFKIPVDKELDWKIFKWINLGKFFEVDQ